jgi:hypothetical protein
VLVGDVDGFTYGDFLVYVIGLVEEMNSWNHLVVSSLNINGM